MAKKRSDLFWAGAVVLGTLVVIAIGLWALFAGNVKIVGDNSVALSNGAPADWNTITNSQYGFSMRYPNGFFDAGRSPKVTTGSCTFLEGCQNMESVKINGVVYCHDHSQDAALDQRYFYDSYTAVKDQTCISIQLNTSESACENYLPLEPGNAEQQTNYNACINKRDNRINILNQIINTFTFQ